MMLVFAFNRTASIIKALKTCMQVLLNHANHKNNSDKSADSDSNPFISLQLLRELEVPMVVQQKQTDHSSYFALNERIVAAESCWFASKVSITNQVFLALVSKYLI